MPKIHLIGHIDVPHDRLAAVTGALPEHIRLTLAEPECEHFSVTASATVTGRFDVEEIFTSRTGFDAHQNRTQSSDWSTVTKGIPRSYVIKELP